MLGVQVQLLGDVAGERHELRAELVASTAAAASTADPLQRLAELSRLPRAERVPPMGAR